MRSNLLTLLMMLIVTPHLKAQNCSNCTFDNQISISLQNGNVFATSMISAQSYFWEMCSGTSTIVGNNLNGTIQINFTGLSTLKLVRFKDGICSSTCVDLTSINCEPPACSITELGRVCVSARPMVSRGYYKLKCNGVETNADWRIVEDPNQENFDATNYTNTAYFRVHITNQSWVGNAPIGYITINAYQPGTNILMASITTFLDDCHYEQSPIKSYLNNNTLKIEGIDATVHKVILYDLNGVLIQEFKNNSNDTFILKRALKDDGIYIVNLVNKNGKIISSQKIR